MKLSTQADFSALANTGISSLQPYQPGKPIEELSRELGITDIIKLASNENPLGPGPGALKKIRESMRELGRYPDGSGYALKARLAEYHDVEPDQITLGNGSNEVLEFAARVFTRPGDEVVFAEHCFIVYPLVVQAIGATPVKVAANDWGHDVEAMARAVTPATRLVFIANPNNPTGTWVDEAPLRRCLESIPSDVVIVLDEAYFEYIDRPDYPDGVALMKQFDNLVVTRTFSKIHGLAAMRLGYSISNTVIADLMNRVRAPFNVSELAMAAAIGALDDAGHMGRSRELNATGLKALEEGITQLGCQFISSVGNFLTVDTRGAGGPIYEALLRQGVIVRPIGGYGMPNHLRVSVGLESENERFLTALETVMNEAGRL
jgi:histidinol-phosphate aminotransferase